MKPLALVADAVGRVFKSTQSAIDSAIIMICLPPGMECERTYEDLSEPNGEGTLPVVTRCWASYTTFFGDGQSLSCTAADTCKRSLTDSTLVMCGACPLESPPNPLTFQFGCDTIIKSCTCGVPRLQPSYCYSNEECAAPAQACAFVDTELELLDAYTLCEACQTRPLCTIPRGASAGRCACGLQELEFARCRPEDVGNLMALPYGKMCALQTDERVTASTSYAAVFSEASVAACMAVDASTSYCMRMVDLADNFYIVSTRTTQARRLLLTTGSDDAAKLGAATTRCAVCRDALAAADSHVRRECVSRFVRSADTVLMLGLHADVSPCAFCSADDFWQLLAQDPMVLPFLAVHPRKLWLVLLRHTPLAHALRVATRLYAQAADLVTVVAHSNVSDYIGINTSASGVVLYTRDNRVVSHHLVAVLQTLARWHAANASDARVGVHVEWGFLPEALEPADGLALAPTDALALETADATPATGRALLSLDDMARQIEFEVKRAFATQNTYTSQISSAFNYNFPQAASAGTSQWLESWPPNLGSSAQGVDGTCTPAIDFAYIVLYAFRNTTLAYGNLEAVPKTSLRASFPGLRSNGLNAPPAQLFSGTNSTNGTSGTSANNNTNANTNNVLRTNNALGANTNAKGTSNDPLLEGMLWLLNKISETLGLRSTLFYDVLYTLITELQGNLKCDLAAAQTCSKWTVSI